MMILQFSGLQKKRVSKGVLEKVRVSTDMNDMKKFLLVIYLLMFLCYGQILYSEDYVPDSWTCTDTEGVSHITIDNVFSDWEDIPPVARFTSYYNPYYYNLELNGFLEVRKIKESFYWKHNGTQLEEVKALMTGDTLYFYFTTQSPIAEGLIIFLYLYKDRDKKETNTYTLELSLNPRSGDGQVFLWEAGKDDAMAVGTVAVSPRALECSLFTGVLPEPLHTDLSKEYSFDLTTCFFEKSTGVYEEFYFTTIFPRDIPTPEDF
jgi:hypothetical protein